MNGADITAEFIATGHGRIFVLAHHPVRFKGECVLIVPPFAEEMNKSRRMITELAQRLVTAGKAVVIADFYGTGDSEGDFSETYPERWLSDLHSVEAWILAKKWSLESIVAIRLGCIVAAQFAQSRATPLVRTVFWQPVLDGARALDQFLRIRVAAALMSDKKESIAELKAKCVAGEVLTVAGYQLSPLLIAQMERLKLLQSVDAQLGALHWFEVLRSPDASVPLPTSNAVTQLQASGQNVSLHTMVGESFWASTEIVCLPQLLDASASCLHGPLRSLGQAVGVQA